MFHKSPDANQNYFQKTTKQRLKLQRLCCKLITIMTLRNRKRKPLKKKEKISKNLMPPFLKHVTQSWNKFRRFDMSLACRYVRVPIWTPYDQNLKLVKS